MNEGEKKKSILKYKEEPPTEGPLSPDAIDDFFADQELVAKVMGATGQDLQRLCHPESVESDTQHVGNLADDADAVQVELKSSNEISDDLDEKTRAVLVRISNTLGRIAHTLETYVTDETVERLKTFRSSILLRLKTLWQRRQKTEKPVYRTLSFDRLGPDEDEPSDLPPLIPPGRDTYIEPGAHIRYFRGRTSDGTALFDTDPE